MKVQLALPDDPDLDLFSSGNVEVDSFFRSRQWFNAKKGKASPATYQFRTEDDQILGYAAAASRNLDHPHENPVGRKKFLVVYAAGIHTKFQGAVDPDRTSQTYAASIFEWLDDLARQVGCFGVSLWIRVDNPRAIRFYEKMGLTKVGNPMQIDDGAQHVTMQKVV